MNKAINQKPKRNQNKTKVKPSNIIDQRKGIEKNKIKLKVNSGQEINAIGPFLYRELSTPKPMLNQKPNQTIKSREQNWKQDVEINRIENSVKSKRKNNENQDKTEPLLNQNTL